MNGQRPFLVTQVQRMQLGVPESAKDSHDGGSEAKPPMKLEIQTK